MCDDIRGSEWLASAAQTLRGMMTVRRRVVAAVTTAACGVFAGAAQADSLQIALQTAAPEQGFPVQLQFSGSAAQPPHSSAPASLYAVVRPAGGASCQSSYGQDQVAAGNASTTLFAGNGQAHVGPGAYSVQSTFQPASGSYLVCAWIEQYSGDGSDSPFPSNEVTAGPISATFTARMPQVSQLSVAPPANPRLGQSLTLAYTTQTDQSLTLFSVVKPAGGSACAGSYELERQGSASEVAVFGDSGDSVFGGPTVTNGTVTESTAGTYVVCAWVEGPSNGEVDAATSTTFQVGVVSTGLCIVPRFAGLQLRTVEQRVLAAHCGVGRVHYVHRRDVRHNQVVGLSPGPGRRLKAGSAVTVTVER